HRALSEHKTLSISWSHYHHSVSYFIYVFRNYYGMTPTEYQERSAQGLPNRDSAASIVAQGNFYGTDRSAEGIRL
ncbi:AraC family transcriptional regulator, partial [Escherichia coli O156:H28]